MTMLDAVYVDPVEEKSVVAIQPKPAFRPLFEIATTRKGSDVVLTNEAPPDSDSPEAPDSCSWWRRGRVELPVQKAPWSDLLQACPVLLVSPLRASTDRISEVPADQSLVALYRHRSARIPDSWRLHHRIRDLQWADVAAI